MNRTRKIIKSLSISYREYDNIRHNGYLSWCASHALKRAMSLRVLVSNKYLYQWYCTQWIYMVEKPFYDQNQEYLEAGVEIPGIYLELLKTFTDSVESIYPGTLLSLIETEQKKHEKLTRRNPTNKQRFDEKRTESFSSKSTKIEPLLLRKKIK